MLRKGNPVPEDKMSGSVGMEIVLLFMDWYQQLRFLFFFFLGHKNI